MTVLIDPRARPSNLTLHKAGIQRSGFLPANYFFLSIQKSEKSSSSIEIIDWRLAMRTP
ncbi:MAG TPA: hypothetical protein VFW44_01700 [Bryobacteraceae bacterium]|nr:hypothetical protein [Bryobacteraceae bacterium]